MFPRKRGSTLPENSIYDITFNSNTSNFTAQQNTPAKHQATIFIDYIERKRKSYNSTPNIPSARHNTSF
jgi:hypothetical protein